MSRAIERYLELGRMEKNRKAEVQQQDRERSPEPMSVVAAVEMDTTVGGGIFAGSATTQTTAVRNPCHA